MIKFNSFVLRPTVAALVVAMASWMKPAASAQLPAPGNACKPPSGERPWMDISQTAECRARLALAAMTPQEKLSFRGNNERLGLVAPGGSDGPNGIVGGGLGVEQTDPVPRARNVTAFPTVITLGATWDRDLARRFGVAVGEEFAGKGMTSVTGPTINLLRTWHWGRAAETFGEDPFHMSELVVPEVLGIQSQRVIAVVKHFAGNNQENTRTGVAPYNAGIDERVSEKALHEIYFPHFKAAVEQGKNGAVMCAYNQINGVFSCNNAWLLGLLREWGFDGAVVPDAGVALRSTVAAARAGVDNLNAAELAALVERGELRAEVTDRIAMHYLVPRFRLGIYDHPVTGNADNNVSTPDHVRLARAIAAQGAVLLKNQGNVLPLAAVKSIAVVGDDAGPHATVMETGSAHVYVDARRLTTPLDAIKARAGSAISVSYSPGTLGIGRLPPLPMDVLRSAGGAPGLDAAYFANSTWDGAPFLTRVDPGIDFSGPPTEVVANADPSLGAGAKATAVVPGVAPQVFGGGGAGGRGTAPPGRPGGAGGGGAAGPGGAAGAGGGRGARPNWSARWTGMLIPPSSGLYRFSIAGGGTAQLYVNHRPVVTLMRADFGMVAHGVIQLAAGRSVPVELKFSNASNLTGQMLRLGWAPPDSDLIATAEKAARQSDVAVVFAAEQEGEGYDKYSLNLPADQDRLIEAVASANPRTVVVLHTSNPVAMPWIDKVAAVVEAWYPGQEAGTSIADVLFGDVNPSGKLPVTFPASETQGPATKWTEYPGDGRTAEFTEGVLVGYRWYDARNQEPLFPFGHGLSYTTFQYDQLQVQGASEGAAVHVRVTNTGKRAGAEVVQLYVEDPSEALEPPRQLKGFEKVMLKPGQSQTMSFTLDKQHLSVWDEGERAWKLVPGTYTVRVGSSSRDLRAKGTFLIRVR
ncbi:MAG TPA: glycoside hydrolase family 3 C-terminal domain-containing protein [Vicinamibacterales bacterium]|nr:glycoside hydrolase family 3 C-terminal domain-containing protein [Vicinamibacterales bacterium]